MRKRNGAGTIKNELKTTKDITMKKQLYILKVALSHSKRVWRKIAILSDQTLDNLHETIFVAFDRYDPHMYSFYLTKKGNRSRTRFAEAPEYTHPYNFEESETNFGFGFSRKKMYDASKTKISDLKLKEKSKFEYLFDFGDEWLHEVTIEKIEDEFKKAKYPQILKKNGESPPQYPDYDEDEEEYDDEEYYE